MTGSSIVIQNETMENFKDALEAFEKKTELKVVQKKFLEFVFDNPDEVAGIALKNYQKRMTMK